MSARRCIFVRCDSVIRLARLLVASNRIDSPAPVEVLGARTDDGSQLATPSGRGLSGDDRRGEPPALWGPGCCPRRFKPLGYVCGVEAQEMAPLEVGDAAFGDKAADVANGDAEMLGDLLDG